MTDQVAGCPYLDPQAPLWAWGDDLDGELGDNFGSGFSSDVPIHPAHPYSGQVTQIAAGVGESAAALADGTLWTWGTTRKASWVSARREATPAHRPRFPR